MYEILKKQELNAQVTLMEIAAPLVAAKAEPGQFIILRTHADGERIPLTIAGFDRERGVITIIFQRVGKTTEFLARMNEGECLKDFVGPLGTASEFSESEQKVVVIGGGLGTAIAYPQAKKLFEMGREVDVIAGFKNADLVILEDELKAAATNVTIATDDGSYGEKGFVTDILRARLEAGTKYDLCIAIGPLPMMKFVSLLTKEYGIKTVVSMNSIMIDGTGMCGCCRLEVGGETKFACVDGPDFDGHLVDYDSAMQRGAFYKQEERESYCRLMAQAEK